MAKEYSVELGGKKRVLRYTRKERVEIESRFDCDIRTFVYSKAFPVDEEGKPTGGGILVCQEALIFYGLRHNGPKITEESVSQWLQDELDQGQTIAAPLIQSILALLASGIMGFTPKFADDEEQEDDEGKGHAGEERTPATVTPIKQTG